MAYTCVLNGQRRDFDALGPTATLAELVAELGLKGDRIAVERNGEIAERGRWSEIVLSQDDRLELVHFVGGGSTGLPPKGQAGRHGNG
ncbi:MAG: sulfur carrier protein ThiS [Acidobacteriota bacterium]|nr:sulfur carrier protein ThiS [Acidobacteriota bacterium]